MASYISRFYHQLPEFRTLFWDLMKPGEGECVFNPVWEKNLQKIKKKGEFEGKERLERLLAPLLWRACCGFPDDE